jgi:hypothetical protein
MITWLLKKFTASAFVSIFRGVAGPILEHYQHKDRQVTARQGTWAAALVSAAQADVEHHAIAAKERATNPWMMFLSFMIIFPPALYSFMFWMDTIFAHQTWSLFGWTLWDWTTYELEKAPDRLEQMGNQILLVTIGGGSAVMGVTKGAKILSNAGVFKGK